MDQHNLRSGKPRSPAATQKRVQVIQTAGTAGTAGTGNTDGGYGGYTVQVIQTAGTAGTAGTGKTDHPPQATAITTPLENKVTLDLLYKSMLTLSYKEDTSAIQDTLNTKIDEVQAGP